MGQKVHPESMRVGYIHDWKSNWFNERNFADYLAEDVAIRGHITGKLAHAGLSDITIRKDANEVKRPELDAKLVAQSIAEQLQNRVAFRRAMKRALTSAIRSGAKGAKIQVSGRLGGSEMARTEMYSDGRVPLHTLRADIDYGFYEARTTFGRIGCKVWINKGEIMPKGFAQDLTQIEAPQAASPGGGGGGGRGGGPGGGGRGGRGGQGGGGRGGPGGPGGRGGGGGGGGRGGGGGGRGP